MYDPVIKEMDIAYAQNESDDDVTKVVQKYFPVGAEFEKLLPLLNQLKDDGFEIREYRLVGSRVWPDGKFHLEGDDLAQLNMKRRYPEGTQGFVIQKKYDIKLLIVTKTAVITFKVDESKKLTEVNGHINISSI